jgi:flavin reductase (DIM6/NTAB) family NADH-FMN oxidoreductase RutF
MTGPIFKTLRRQEFRRFFQPSRVLLGVLPASTGSGVNIITLCFSMYCSYKPPMMAVAIHKHAASYGLAQRTGEYVLSVPGESLASEAMYCGIQSMADVDKVKRLNLDLAKSQTIAVPGIVRAIANIEMVRTNVIPSGDHLLLVGAVKRFGVNTDSKDRPLISLGPNTTGYTLLLKKGIHRLGVVGEP